VGPHYLSEQTRRQTPRKHIGPQAPLGPCRLRLTPRTARSPSLFPNRANALYSPAASVNLTRRYHDLVLDTAETSALLSQWSQFLGNYEWDHVATLTSRFEVSSTKLAKVFEDRFIRGLARDAQQRITWFTTVEGGRDDLSRSHLHCVLAGTERLTNRRIESAWPLGFTRVARFAGTPMLQYLVKSLDENPDGWRMSRLLPNQIRQTPETQA
jgi:hypothetical protein